MTKRGWTSEHLTLVVEDDRLWTVEQAAFFLGKTQASIRFIIRERGIQPVGTYSRTGPERRGRQPRVFRAIDLIKTYDALSKAA